MKTQKTFQITSGCILGLVIFAVFLGLSPPSKSSRTYTTLFFLRPFAVFLHYSVFSFNSSSVFSNQYFSSFFSHFFPSSKQIVAHNVSFSALNKTQNVNLSQSTIEVPDSLIKQNHSIIYIEIPKFPNKKNQSIVKIPKSPIASNFTGILAPKPLSLYKNITQNGEGVLSNLTSTLVKKQSKNESNLVNNGTEDLVNRLMSCDLFDGEWVKDDSYPLYKTGSCSLIDEQFNCFRNGRPDNGYNKLKWKPKGCSIPRLNGTRMLEMLRGKRLVFVGDSLNRNMWESLVCILRNSLKDQSKVYEVSGSRYFRIEPFYSFVFKDYDCTIEFFVSPFLVQEWEMTEKSGSKKERLRLNLSWRLAAEYKTADILVFNMGHWWTHEKTAKGKDYYQEGKHIYHDMNDFEVFHKTLTTWGKWVDANVDPKKSLVFFRGYSPSHFKGGQYNSGGQCDKETEPIKNITYLSRYPPKMAVLEQVLNNMETHVSYLNITRLTDYRKDGHPSVYRKHAYSREGIKPTVDFQDCSHWCLPGVPDSWNELLYTELLIKESQNKK